MISAHQAHIISMNNEGNIDDIINKQAEEISRIIINTAKKGYFTLFYDQWLHHEVYEMLEETGFKLSIIFEDNKDNNNIKVFKGINISW